MEQHSDSNEHVSPNHGDDAAGPPAQPFESLPKGMGADLITKLYKPGLTLEERFGEGAIVGLQGQMLLFNAYVHDTKAVGYFDEKGARLIWRHRLNPEQPMSVRTKMRASIKAHGVLLSSSKRTLCSRNTTIC